MNKTPTLFSLAMTAIALCACSKDAAPGAAGSASAVTSVAAPASAAPSGTPAPPSYVAPKWLATIPVKPVSAKVGDRIWGPEPFSNQESAGFNIREIDANEGNTATTSALMRMGGSLVKDTQYAPKLPNVPGALISATRTCDVAKVRAKDLVVTPVFGYVTTVAQVDKLDGKSANIKYVNYDKLLDEHADYCEPLGTGVEPFAYVAVKNGANYKQGLVMAVVDGQVYAIDENNMILKAAKADVKPLKIQWKDRKKGDKVTVFDYTGSTDTVIESVPTPKWVFEVKVNGQPKKVPFFKVVDKL